MAKGAAQTGLFHTNGIEPGEVIEKLAHPTGFEPVTSAFGER